MREEIKLEQGTEDWLAFRRQHRMASETPAVLGVSGYQTPTDVRKAKRGKSIADNPAMRQGREQEPLARAAYEALHEPMRPAIYVDGAYGCSLDGINMDENIILEIKTPFLNAQISPRWKAAIAGQLMPEDQAQVQHQLMVTGADAAHFWVWDAQEQQGIMHIVAPDPAYWKTIKDAWDTFWPTLSKRDDKKWVIAAEQYKQAKQVADAAAAQLAECKKNMLSLASGEYMHGAGVEVKQIKRMGTVDWQTVHKQLLAGVDVEPFRKEGSEYYEVRVQS